MGQFRVRGRGLRHLIASHMYDHIGRLARRRGSHPASGAADEVEQGPQWFWGCDLSQTQ